MPHFINLQVLDLGENNQIQPSQLAGLPALVELRLHCNGLKGIVEGLSAGGVGGAGELRDLTALKVG